MSELSQRVLDIIASKDALIQSLTQENKELKAQQGKEAMKTLTEMDQLWDENKALREALEKYADEENWDCGEDGLLTVFHEGYELAQTALNNMKGK